MIFLEVLKGPDRSAVILYRYILVIWPLNRGVPGILVKTPAFSGNMEIIKANKPGVTTQIVDFIFSMVNNLVEDTFHIWFFITEPGFSPRMCFPWAICPRS